MGCELFGNSVRRGRSGLPGQTVAVAVTAGDGLVRVEVTDRGGPVGADNPVTLCDLGIFMDQAAESVPAQNAYTGYFGRRIRTSGGRLLLQ